MLYMSCSFQVSPVPRTLLGSISKIFLEWLKFPLKTSETALLMSTESPGSHVWESVPSLIPFGKQFILSHTITYAVLLWDQLISNSKSNTWAMWPWQETLLLFAWTSSSGKYWPRFWGKKKKIMTSTHILP